MQCVWQNRHLYVYNFGIHSAYLNEWRQWQSRTIRLLRLSEPRNRRKMVYLAFFEIYLDWAIKILKEWKRFRSKGCTQKMLWWFTEAEILTSYPQTCGLKVISSRGTCIYISSCVFYSPKTWNDSYAGYKLLIRLEWMMWNSFKQTSKWNHSSQIVHVQWLICSEWSHNELVCDWVRFLQKNNSKNQF